MGILRKGSCPETVRCTWGNQHQIATNQWKLTAQQRHTQLHSVTYRVLLTIFFVLESNLNRCLPVMSIIACEGSCDLEPKDSQRTRAVHGYAACWHVEFVPSLARTQGNFQVYSVNKAVYEQMVFDSVCVDSFSKQLQLLHLAVVMPTDWVMAAQASQRWDVQYHRYSKLRYCTWS